MLSEGYAEVSVEYTSSIKDPLTLYGVSFISYAEILIYAPLSLAPKVGLWYIQYWSTELSDGSHLYKYLRLEESTTYGNLVADVDQS